MLFSWVLNPVCVDGKVLCSVNGRIRYFPVKGKNTIFSNGCVYMVLYCLGLENCDKHVNGIKYSMDENIQ